MCFKMADTEAGLGTGYDASSEQDLPPSGDDEMLKDSSPSMAQDKENTTDDEEGGLCYCGKDRNLGSVELQCASCLRFYHSECISCYLGKCLPFMTNYHFICKRCNPNGLESFTKKQASFSQMCHTVVANLTYQNAPTRIFSKDTEIIPFFEKHWETLTYMAQRKKPTWHNTIHKTMMKETDIFLCVEERAGDPHFGLLSEDLSKIGPAYGNSGDAKLSSSLNDSKGRSAKRKAAPADPNWVPPGFKQKKGEVTTATKLAPHGYPLEHPFNKDGYRYILAEPDPHAPNRQAFDESVEWAGKPIPGYLYRTFLGSQVLLALHDRAPQLKISDDRLTVTGEKGYSMVRATHCVNKGGWYFEVKIDEMPPETAVRMGWSMTLGNLQAPCGYDKFSYSWRSKKGTRFHESRGKHYSEGYGEGDVVGFYIYLPWPTKPGKLLPATYKDRPLVKFKSHLYYEEKDNVQDTEKNLKPAVGSKLIMFKNGISQGVAWTDIHEASYYPCISLYKNATVTLNFGPDFKYPPKDLENFQPISAAAEDAVIENTLSEILYHVENEGKHPDFL